MPQLSPMMGVMVFLFTNLSFITVVMSIRSTVSVQNLETTKETLKSGFRGFS